MRGCVAGRPSLPIDLDCRLGVRVLRSLIASAVRAVNQRESRAGAAEDRGVGKGCGAVSGCSDDCDGAALLVVVRVRLRQHVQATEPKFLVRRQREVRAVVPADEHSRALRFRNRNPEWRNGHSRRDQKVDGIEHARHRVTNPVELPPALDVLGSVTRCPFPALSEHRVSAHVVCRSRRSPRHTRRRGSSDPTRPPPSFAPREKAGPASGVGDQGQLHRCFRPENRVERDIEGAGCPCDIRLAGATRLCAVA